MKFDVVMISAKQGGGKTTLAKAIKDKALEVDPAWVVSDSLIFAGPIYEMHDACRKILTDAGVDPVHKVKDGNLLQLLGTEWGRNHIDDNIWVKVIQGRVEAFRATCEKLGAVRVTVIIPDLRFPNEFDAFPAAITIRLECPEDVRKERVMKTSMWRENTSHPSETSLDHYAELNMFDRIFNTHQESPERIAAQVVDIDLALDK